MRILKLDMPGVLHSKSADIKLDEPAVQAQVFRELDKLSGELADRIRAKATAYLPRDYTLFSRVAFDPRGNRVDIVMWIDDPTVSGFSSLLARRAWQLSVPILAHIVREAAEERLQTLAIEIEEARTRVSAFAPSRAWRNPVIIAVGSAVLASLYWLWLHSALMGLLRRTIGG